MKYDSRYVMIMVFLITGAGLFVYGASGFSRLAALLTGTVLVATGSGWLARWAQEGRRK